MPAFPGRPKPESLAALPALTTPLLTGYGAVVPWKLTLEGSGWSGLGFEFRALIKVGAGPPSVQWFCSSLEVLPALVSERIRGFGVMWCLGFDFGLSFPLKGESRVVGTEGDTIAWTWFSALPFIRVTLNLPQLPHLYHGGSNSVSVPQGWHV